MKTIVNKHIDLSNYEQKDLKFNTDDNSTLCIQVLNINSTLSIFGKNTHSSAKTLLHGISNSFETVNSISTNGLYTFDVSGVDNIEISYNGTAGDIYIKVVD